MSRVTILITPMNLLVERKVFDRWLDGSQQEPRFGSLFVHPASGGLHSEFVKPRIVEFTGRARLEGPGQRDMGSRLLRKLDDTSSLSGHGFTVPLPKP